MSVSPAGGEPTLATSVKAAYLTKLAPFVTWPSTAEGGKPFILCLVGGDPFGQGLDASLSGITVGDRPYQVARVDTVGAGSTCDIAYLHGSARQSVADALRAVSGTPTLTVTDEGAPAGIVSFKMQAGKVRFRIDKVAADQNGLVLSSKLLSLALSVKTDKGVIEP